MSEALIRHVWLKTRSELPGRLDIDTVYHIADEGVFVIDHGAGAVTFGAQKAVDTLEGDETDRAPSVHAVNEGLKAIPGVTGLDRGVFETPEALTAAHPMDVQGAYATVLSTGTIWIWSATSWADSGKASQAVEVVDNLVTASALKALSAKQGMILNKKLGTKASAEVISLSIPVEAWIEDTGDATGYPWHANILNTVIGEDMIPFLTLNTASTAVALEAGLCSSMQTQNGAARVFSAKKLAAEISGTLALLAPSGEILTDADFATDEEVENILAPIWGN